MQNKSKIPLPPRILAEIRLHPRDTSPQRINHGSDIASMAKHHLNQLSTPTAPSATPMESLLLKISYFYNQDDVEMLKNLSTEFKDAVLKVKSKKDQGKPLSEAEQILLTIADKFTALDHLPPILRHPIGPYEVVFNPLRSLRPPRMAAAKSAPPSRYNPTPIGAPFNPSGFHFAGPEINDQRLGQTPQQVDLLFNLYPMAKGHFLGVPDRLNGHHPQILDAAILKSLDQLTKLFPKAKLSWNAKGAFASVNHAHIQMIAEELPIAKQPLSLTYDENTGRKRSIVSNWPAEVRICKSIEEVRELINSTVHPIPKSSTPAPKIKSTHSQDIRKQKNKRGQTVRPIPYCSPVTGEPIYYNIYVSGNRYYVFFRRDQQLFGKTKDGLNAGIKIGTGPAFAELAGRITIATIEEFNALVNDPQAKEKIDAFLKQESIKVR